MQIDTMIIMSTGNQTVNIIPAMQLNIKVIIILTTNFMKKDTEYLIDVLKKYNFIVKQEEVENDVEHDPIKIENLIKVVIIKNKLTSVYININGGQKYYPMGAYGILKDYKQDVIIKLVYMDIHTRNILITNQNLLQEEPILTESKLLLNDILKLYGYEIKKNGRSEKIKIDSDNIVSQNIKKIINYYLTNDLFREIFIRSSDRKNNLDEKILAERIKKFLSYYKPDLNNMQLTDIGYESLEMDIQSLSHPKLSNYDVNKILNRISNKSEIFNKYWNCVKKSIIDYVLTEAHLNDPDINNFQIYDGIINLEMQKEINSIFSDIGGSVTFSYPDKGVFKKDIKFQEKIGDTFEEMVLYEVLSVIKSNIEIRNKIFEIYKNVETVKLGMNTKLNESEYDIVIVTTYGTLIILEMKAGYFDSDTITSKDYGAYKKSGTYGKSALIGPIIDKLKKDDGTLFDFVPFAIKAHENKAKLNSIEYVQFDKIEEYLSKTI